jgi:hypothetical protein
MTSQNFLAETQSACEAGVFARLRTMLCIAGQTMRPQNKPKILALGPGRIHRHAADGLAHHAGLFGQ